MLHQAGVPVVQDCSKLSGLTLSAAKAMAGLPAGGLALAVLDPCVDGFYDPSIECYIGLDVCYDARTGASPTAKFWRLVHTLPCPNVRILISP